MVCMYVHVYETLSLCMYVCMFMYESDWHIYIHYVMSLFVIDISTICIHIYIHMHAYIHTYIRLGTDPRLHEPDTGRGQLLDGQRVLLRQCVRHGTYIHTYTYMHGYLLISYTIVGGRCQHNQQYPGYSQRGQAKGFYISLCMYVCTVYVCMYVCMCTNALTDLYRSYIHHTSRVVYTILQSYDYFLVINSMYVCMYVCVMVGE